MGILFKILVLLSVGAHGFCWGQSTLGPPLVIVDPGHGGSDSGAIGVNGMSEKDIVLQVGQEMVRLNREIHSGSLELYLTRYADTLISLGDRTRLARALKVDAYLSIHCNQANRSGAQGIEVYVPKGKGGYRESSHGLATTICQNLNHNLGLKDRGVKVANFQVLRETTHLSPSVLVELGFLSNRNEAEHLSKETGIRSIAMAILETLIAHFDERDLK